MANPSNFKKQLLVGRKDRRAAPFWPAPSILEIRRAKKVCLVKGKSDPFLVGTDTVMSLMD
jgi:hypothetical protein